MKIAQRPRSTFTTYQTYYKPGDVLPISGLVGPVAIRFFPLVRFEKNGHGSVVNPRFQPAVAVIG